MSDNRNANLWQNRGRDPRTSGLVDGMSVAAHKVGESMKKRFAVIVDKWGIPSTMVLPDHLPYRR